MERKALKVQLVHRELRVQLAHRVFRAIRAIKASKELRVIKALPLFGTSLAHTAGEPLTPLVTLRPMTGRLGIESTPMVATSVTLQVRERSGHYLPIRALKARRVIKAFKALPERRVIREFKAQRAHKELKVIRVSKERLVRKVLKAKPERKATKVRKV